MGIDLETRALMTVLAKEAAENAVEQTLLTIGIDRTNPIKAQRDMAALHELRELVDNEDFQKDMIHLHRWRKTMEGVEKKGVLAALSLMFIGGIAFILYAIKLKLG